MSSSTLFLIATLGVLALVRAFLRNISDRTGTTERSKSPLYRKKGRLVTAAERSFLGILDLALEGRYRVCAKVRLADVLKPQTGMTRGTWQSAFNKLSSTHLDFALCDGSDLSPVAAVELDDKSRQRSDGERDQFLKAVLRRAQLPLLRIPVQIPNSLHELRASIESLLRSSTRRELADAPPEFSLPTVPKI